MRTMLMGLVWSVALMSGAALAQEVPAPATDASVNAEEASSDSLQIILAQQRDLQLDLADGGIEGLSARENRHVREAQDEVFGLTDGKPTLDALAIDEKVQLENALERINALVKNTRAGRDAQDVCWRERKTGSSIEVTRCGAKEEIQQAREGARAWLSRPKVCGLNCGG